MQRGEVMNKCFVCGQESVIWKSDFSYEDFQKDGDGIVSMYECMNCGAYYTVEQDIKENKDVT